MMNMLDEYLVLMQNGFPQIIPMNFVFLNDAVYMHSHVKGEKLDNIA